MFILVLTVYFISATSGLKCYVCNDGHPDVSCDKPSIKNCFPGEEYCTKVFMTSEADYGKVVKHCAPKTQHCKSSSSFPVPPNSGGTTGTVHCCQGDLCNSSGKLSNQNFLFYAIVLSCFFSLFNYF